MISAHYANDRQSREKLIEEIGYGTIVKTVVVDRGHRNGPEIHSISSTGIIIIRNQRTNKLITKLIARPGQIIRYYESKEQTPNELIEIAYIHLKMGYNTK